MPQLHNEDGLTPTRGVIYILTNPAFPEYVKIGYADKLENRLRSLNNSSVPMHFRVYAVYETSERLTDKKVHELIDILNPDLRVIDKFDGKEHKREFYVISAENAFTLFECIAKISGTTSKLKRMKPNGKEVLEENEAREIDQESRREPFRFSLCGISVGEKVVYRNDENIIAEVADDKHVLYDGKKMSLTALAKQLLNTDTPIAGTIYFKYKGKILAELRTEKEKNN